MLDFKRESTRLISIALIPRITESYHLENNGFGSEMSNLNLNDERDCAMQAELDQIATRIFQALRSRLRSLRIVLHPNGIVLHGSAYSYYGKQLAQHAVIRATNHPLLGNEISVM